MDDRLERLESQVANLLSRLSELENRVTSVEAAGAVVVTAAAAKSSEAETAPPQASGLSRTDAIGVFSLVGRLSIVMGGAYLLRALTESGLVSRSLGITFGLAYSLVWIIAADRAAAKGRMYASAFHTLAAALVAFPLIWESVTAFRIISPAVGALALGLLSALILVTACRFRFQLLAWIAVLSVLAAAFSIVLTTDAIVPYAILLIVLGVTTLWLGYELEWRLMRWPVAFMANLLVLVLALRTVTGRPQESPGAVLAVQLLLLGLYLASVAIRTLLRARNVIVFEVVQLTAAFLLGFVGAVYVSRATGSGTALLGYAGILLGGAFYAVAFAFVDRLQGRGRNFYYYTSLALVFTLTGSGLLLEGAPLFLAWAALGVVFCWLGSRFSRIALLFNATVCLVLSAAASGLTGFALSAFAAPPGEVGSLQLSLAPLVNLMAIGLCLAIPLPAQFEGGPIWSRILRLAMAIPFVCGLGAIAVTAASSAWGGTAAGYTDAGILATIRTVVLALAAAVLAWAGRQRQFLEWGWLVYPVLALTGIKMLLEDMPQSRPATLFIALAAYGGALIASPRLRRRMPSSAHPRPGGGEAAEE